MPERLGQPKRSTALWNLVRLMETNGLNGFAKKADNRAGLVEKFAIEGGERLRASRPTAMMESAPDITTAAFELMDRNDRDGSSFGRKIASIRRGVFAFYAIVELRNPDVAFRTMIEHMQAQVSDDTMHDFMELKQLLGLPVERQSVAAIAEYAKAGLPRGRANAILRAARASRIFDGVVYRPPGEDRVCSSAAILEEMREYGR